MKVLQRKTAADFDQRLLDLYDEYCHGLIDRREFASGVTCHCDFPPPGVRVRPFGGRTDEASKVHGRADHRGA